MSDSHGLRAVASDAPQSNVGESGAVGRVAAGKAAGAVLDLPSFGADFMANWNKLQGLLALGNSDRIREIVEFQATAPKGNGKHKIVIEPEEGKHKGLAFAYFLLSRFGQSSASTDGNSLRFSRRLTRQDKVLARAFFAQVSDNAPGTRKHAMIDALLRFPTGTMITLSLMNQPFEG